MNGTILDTLRHMAGGAALEELTDAQAKLLAMVREHQGPGQLTLVINYTPRTQSQVRLSYDVKVKDPKRERPDSLFFIDDRCIPLKDDPRQGKLDIDPDQPRRPAAEEVAG